MTRVCVRCTLPMVPQKKHPPKGWAQHHARGFCRRCYPRHYYHVPSQGAGVRGGGARFDEIAVERACRGDRPPLLWTREIAAAVDVLTRRGMTTLAIARQLGVTDRTVTRHRAKLRRAP